MDAAGLAAMAAASAEAFLPCGAAALDPGLPQLGWAGPPDATLGGRWQLFFRGRVDEYTVDMEQAAERLVPHLMRFAVRRGGSSASPANGS